ncbi:MAG TPA: hypothetical protein PLP19_19420 [bacterium]|nr:hypothetical protein [bacterium]HPN45667.1 hypothetical protein [bacterium]
MSAFRYILYAALIAAFLTIACKKDYATDNLHRGANIQYIRFTENNCLETYGLGKTLTTDYRVTGYELNDNELTLHILYKANCCPEFADQVTIIGNTVDIALDANDAGCYCECNFINDFTFLYYGNGAMRVIFRLRDIGQSVYTTHIDTLLNIQ